MKNNRYKNHETSVIVLAGGKGTRMGSETPKQYMTLGNKTVIEYSIETFHDFCSKIIVIVPNIEKASFITDKYPGVELSEAKESRIESLLQELRKIDTKYVLVHDASRPFVTNKICQSILTELETHACAYPVIGLASSIVRDQNDLLTESPDRSQFREVQTPQGFHANILREALQKFSDKHIHIPELVRMLGEKVKHVPGSPWLFKITFAPDIHAAEYYAKKLNSSP